ncbi:MAG: thioredoxin [Halothiobacillaceae bacterium]|nr:MAG: thioredoxin [Halothiobacillaceae bacterium]
MSDFVFDATEQDFAAKVIQASHARPVVVDFWASWCQPCQILKPLLKKVVESYDGDVLLAYVDTDQEQNLAAQFGIRSLPTVMVLKDGRAVDQFMGAQPEGAIRTIIDKHIVRETDLMLRQSMMLLEQGDEVAALEMLQQANRIDPRHSGVLFALARFAAHSGNLDEALAIANVIPEDAPEAAMARELKAQIGFQRQAQAMEGGAGNMAELLGRIDANPADCEAREKLATVLVSQGQHEAAMEMFLDIMKRDRAFNDDAGRKGLLQMFEMLGANHPAVSAYRRRMFGLMH